MYAISQEYRGWIGGIRDIHIRLWYITRTWSVEIDKPSDITNHMSDTLAQMGLDSWLCLNDVFRLYLIDYQ